MLIYIIHSDKIYKSRLSNDGSIKQILSDFDSNNNKRTLVSVELKDDSWEISETENVKIEFNGQKVKQVKLVAYEFYKLTILGSEVIYLYIMPLYDSSFLMQQIADGTSIICGSIDTADIIFRSNIAKEQLQLDFKDGKFYFKNLNPDISIYVNQIKYDEGFIQNFDTIFIMGLKIIICGNKLLFNNPSNLVYVNAQKFIEPIDSCLVDVYNTEVRTFNDFYSESEYYYKSPLFKLNIQNLKITITEPPSKPSKDTNSTLMSVIPTILMSSSFILITISTMRNYSKGQTTFEDLLSSLLMCGGMIAAGILWPFVEKIYNNRRVSKSIKKRNNNYHKYLKEKEKTFQDAITNQKMILVNNNISLDKCQHVIEYRSPELFSRDIDSDDFLNIRLGIGKIGLKYELEYTKPDYVEEVDELLTDIDNLIEKNKYIENAPFVISLKEKNIIAFILENRSLFNDYIIGVLLQLLTFHSYFDLKIVVFASDEFSEISCLKQTNHCWNNDHTFRYFASNLDEAQNISTNLEREFKLRRSNTGNEQPMNPYYLIITDSIEKYRSLNIIRDIMDCSTSVNFGLMMFDMKISNIPNDCINFVSITNKEGTIFQTNVGTSEILSFQPEYVHNYKVNVDYCIRLLNNIPLKDVSNEASSLPENVGFLQMYEVGNVEQLNAPTRWDNSSPANSLSAPIGVDVYGNLISLDLHERNHGPHGLIAGMTGSGKSEFIVTYILSLAINYRPDEVQFVLIDYKGGGLAGAFENRKTGIKLPHLVGTITNLDKSEMHRTLVSIKSELQRRQRLFNVAKEKLDTGSIDIYKYQKLHRDGALEEPLSHLFIICDEFAELKASQPDFMDELVSAARIGRSLGVHLILATQKPSGVVDEQIWSNSKFKVCCKVQTVDDSNEMLRKPDAAFLKESGRFYLQVGYDEYFIEGQSAYSGGPYIPSDTINTKIDNSLSFISNTGEIYKSISGKDNVVTKKREDLGEELINILKYLIDIANKQNFKYQQLWLDNVPKLLYYDQLVKKYNIQTSLFDIEPVIGEYDDPKNQKQGPVTIPLTKEGNTYLVGASGSGKSTLLTTLIYSSIINHNCDEVNFYIIDLGMEKLKKFQHAPQVGDILTISDSEKIEYLFYMLEHERNERQRYYVDNGGDFLTDVKQKKCPFPNIIVIIYDIEVFKEAYSDLYDEKFVSFTRNCSKYGINFIVTATTTSSLGFMAENNFPQKIMLNMVDPTDYAVFFDRAPIPNKNPGRGLVKIDAAYEFQVPLIFEENVEVRNLNYVLSQLDKFLLNKAKPVPVVPAEVKFTDISHEIKRLDRVPLGINVHTAQIGCFNFDKPITIMSSSKVANSVKFISTFTKILSTLSNIKVIVLNGLNDVEIEYSDSVVHYDTGFKKVFPVLDQNIEKYSNIGDSNNIYMIVVLGFQNLNKHMNTLKEEDSNTKNLYDLINHAKNNKHFKFILFDPASLFDEIKTGELSNIIDTSTGIWIGRSFDSQNCIEAPDSYNDNVKMTNDIAVLVQNGKTEYVKFVNEMDE